ncbi:MAG: divalent-cation tolerance protein CutA [Desulfobulbaceae bacterium]|nr:divalent-cation tolerance protein CutA [Desulfobulbaceae bacterium]
MTEYMQVVTTVETKEDAEKIARELLEKRLAACVQISGQVKSFYWWDEKIENAAEYVCVIKSRRDLYEEIESVINKIHPYDVPEILAIPVLAGGKGYLNWLAKELR